MDKDCRPNSPILRLSFFRDSAPGKFYESPNLRLEVNSSEILRTKKYCVGGCSKTEIRNSSASQTQICRVSAAEKNLLGG
jgi:hypothetical protein